MTRSEDEEKKELLQNRMDRRRALSTMGKVAIGVVGAAVVVGGGVYLASQMAGPGTTTVTAAPSTVTVTAAPTTVTTATTTVVPTTITTATTTVVPTTVTTATTTVVPTTTTITTATSAAKPKITMLLATSYTYSTQKNMEAICYAWAAKNSVDLELNWIDPGAPFMQKMASLLEAGNVPDIMSSSSGFGVLGEDPKTRVLMPIDEVVSEVGRDEFLPQLLKALSFEGKQYGVPWYCEHNYMHYRRDLFESVGVMKWPETWDEVYDACVKLKKAKPEMYPFGYSMGPGEDSNTMTAYWSHNGYYLKGRSVADLGLNSQEVLNAINDVKRFWDAELIPPESYTWLGVGNNQAYLSGLSAIVINAPSVYYTALQQALPFVKYTDYIPPPTAGGLKKINMGWMRWFAVSKDTKYPDLCKDLLVQVYKDQPGLLKAAVESWGFQGPPLKPVLEQYKKLGGWHAQVAEAVEYAHFQWPLDEFTKLMDIFFDVEKNTPKMWSRICVDKWSPEKAQEEAYNRLKELCLEIYGK